MLYVFTIEIYFYTCLYTEFYLYFVKTNSGKTKIGRTVSNSNNGWVFGAYLKKLREKKNLKLNEAGIDLKIDPTLLSKYESGTRFPKKDKLNRIAEYFKTGNNELARMIAQDKQKTHYRRLASENNNKKSKK